jgi:hypothetical protein
MGEESSKLATTLTGAVFVSYASQDAGAAQRICAALRSVGIEVWFDQSELRGGDAWDQSIRKQIKACALFLPVISQNTHDRVEGYFRLEWKLAVDRSYLISADQAFLLPVVIDDTREDDERVPERFREVHWTRLPGGATPAAGGLRRRSLRRLPYSSWHLVTLWQSDSTYRSVSQRLERHPGPQLKTLQLPPLTRPHIRSRCCRLWI